VRARKHHHGFSDRARVRAIAVQFIGAADYREKIIGRHSLGGLSETGTGKRSGAPEGKRSGGEEERRRRGAEEKKSGGEEERRRRGEAA
jgi:hypothetical protein